MAHSNIQFVRTGATIQVIQTNGDKESTTYASISKAKNVMRRAFNTNDVFEVVESAGQFPHKQAAPDYVRGGKKRPTKQQDDKLSRAIMNMIVSMS